MRVLQALGELQNRSISMLYQLRLNAIHTRWVNGRRPTETRSENRLQACDLAGDPPDPRRPASPEKQTQWDEVLPEIFG